MFSCRGLSARNTQPGLLGTRVEHKREANCNGAWILGICSLTAIALGLYLVDDLIGSKIILRDGSRSWSLELN